MDRHLDLVKGRMITEKKFEDWKRRLKEEIFKKWDYNASNRELVEDSLYPKEIEEIIDNLRMIEEDLK